MSDNMNYYNLPEDIKNMLKREKATQEEIDKFKRVWQSKTFVIPGAFEFQIKDIIDFAKEGNSKMLDNQNEEFERLCREEDAIRNMSSSDFNLTGVKRNIHGFYKEVIGFHETINPYDWNLDIEANKDFKLWEEEMFNSEDE
jgi:hypothetical protein